MAKKVQKYAGAEITVYFDPNRCMHAGKCVRELPDVFDVNRRPWVMPDAADADVLATMVLTCPSGALTFERDGEVHSGSKPDINSATVMPDGALYIHAEMTINGEEQPTYRAALCRCGKTQRPPYCDNSHKEAGFLHDTQNMQGDIDENVATGGRLEVVAIQDGPLMFRGGCEVRNVNGEVVAKGKELFFCRCGHSENKPFCDGSHNKINFRSD